MASNIFNEFEFGAAQNFKIQTMDDFLLFCEFARKEFEDARVAGDFDGNYGRHDKYPYLRFIKKYGVDAITFLAMAKRIFHLSNGLAGIPEKNGEPGHEYDIDRCYHNSTKTNWRQMRSFFIAGSAFGTNSDGVTVNFGMENFLIEDQQKLSQALRNFLEGFGRNHSEFQNLQDMLVPVNIIGFFAKPYMHLDGYTELMQGVYEVFLNNTSDRLKRCFKIECTPNQNEITGEPVLEGEDITSEIQLVSALGKSPSVPFWLIAMMKTLGIIIFRGYDQTQFKYQSFEKIVSLCSEELSPHKIEIPIIYMPYDSIPGSDKEMVQVTHQIFSNLGIRGSKLRTIKVNSTLNEPTFWKENTGELKVYRKDKTLVSDSLSDIIFSYGPDAPDNLIGSDQDLSFTRFLATALNLV